LNIAATSLRRTAVIALAVALLLGGLIVLLGNQSGSSAVAGVNDNQNNCKGHIEKGDPDPNDATAITVKYVFACSNPITGYALFYDGHPIQSIDTEVFALDPAGKDVVPTDSFSCNGQFPGYGENCVGTYSGNWNRIEGQLSIDTKLCDEPRLDPILTVVNATVNAAGKPVQAMAGPFDLGRPHGCPKSKYGGKTKIPADKGGDTTVIQPVGSPT